MLLCALQVICENSEQPLVVQLVDSGTSNISIRAQDFTDLAPAYLGGIPVSVQLVMQPYASSSSITLAQVIQQHLTSSTFRSVAAGQDNVATKW